MTKPRDPLSIHGAWWDTGQEVGWPVLARACGVSDKVCQEWSDPERCKNGPVQPKADIGDKLLIQIGRAPYNHIATGARIGLHGDAALEHVANATRYLELAARALERPSSEGWDFLGLMKGMADLRTQAALVDRRCIATQDRLEADQSEATARRKEVAADQPRFPERPALRSVGGRD